MTIEETDQGVTLTNNFGLKGFFHEKLFCLISEEDKQYIINDIRSFMHVSARDAEYIFNKICDFYREKL